MSADTENGEASAKEDTSREEEEEEGGEGEGGGESKEEKNETKKTPRKRVAPSEEKKEGERKSTRPPKQITPFKPPEPKDKDEGITIPAGKGTLVGDIDNCVTALKSYKNDDPVVGKLHRLMFGVGGKKTQFKQNIRLFKGLAPGEDRAKLLKKIMASKLEVKDLRPMAHILDLDYSGTRDELIENVTDFLLHPKSSGKAYRKAPSSSSSGSKKKGQKRKSSSKKDEHTPRAPSGYMMFVKEKRASVVAKNTEASFGDIGKLLGKKWNKLSDSEKAEWTEKGRKLGPKKEKKSKAKSSSSKKSKKSNESSSSSEDANSSEEEEEEEEEDEALSEAIRAKIKSIVASGVAELTIRQIKEQLKTDFADEVANKGAEIKIFVHKCVETQ